MRPAASLPLLALLAACSGGQGGAHPQASVATGGIQLRPVPRDEQVPDYAKQPYEPFSRENLVAIALREWRAWGMRVNDAPPGRDMPVPDRPDRQPGMWQRVGDYWWFGQDAATSGSAWTGKYTDGGQPYSGEPAAWSAAFISYVMRSAGAGDRFPYSPLHATYINAAAQGNPIIQAAPPDSYAPVQGDLICYGRRGAERLRITDLPAPSFYGHCDIVIQADPGMLTVIGGNVSAGVTMKHVPTTAAGFIADTDGRPVDARYPWFVVLKVTYDQPAFTSVALSPMTTLSPAATSAPIVLAPPEPDPEPEPVAIRPRPRAKPPTRRPPAHTLQYRPHRY